MGRRAQVDRGVSAYKVQEKIKEGISESKEGNLDLKSVWNIWI